MYIRSECYPSSLRIRKEAVRSISILLSTRISPKCNAITRWGETNSLKIIKLLD